MSTLLQYDAPAILGLGEPSSEPLPEPIDNEVVIRVGAFSLQDLRTCKTVSDYNLMGHQDWYDKHPFSREKLTPGVYRVRLQIQKSNNKGYNDQRKLLLPDEEVMPVALAAATILSHRRQMWRGAARRSDLPLTGFTRCMEMLGHGYRVSLHLEEGQLHVCHDSEHYDHASIWLSGCRKV